MAYRILTANRLTDGLVVYLGPSGWTADFFSARRAEGEDDAEALLADGRKAIARNEVADAYLIDIDDDRPVRRREQIRSRGPTVRPDLGRQAGERA